MLYWVISGGLVPGKRAKFASTHRALDSSVIMVKLSFRDSHALCIDKATILGCLGQSCHVTPHVPCCNKT